MMRKNVDFLVENDVETILRTSILQTKQTSNKFIIQTTSILHLEYKSHLLHQHQTLKADLCIGNCKVANMTYCG